MHLGHGVSVVYVLFPVVMAPESLTEAPTQRDSTPRDVWVHPLVMAPEWPPHKLNPILRTYVLGAAFFG